MSTPWWPPTVVGPLSEGAFAVTGPTPAPLLAATGPVFTPVEQAAEWPGPDVFPDLSLYPRGA
jgi:hypothetical protein